MLLDVVLVPLDEVGEILRICRLVDRVPVAHLSGRIARDPLLSRFQHELLCPLELDDAQRRRAAARFRWLRGESAGATAAEPPASARLTRPQLAQALSSLGLDVGERDVSDMLSCFDSGGGGGEGLSFADFLRLVQQLPSSVLD